MTNIIKICVNVVHVFSFCILMVIGIIGMLYELIGARRYEQILSAMGISNGFKWTWIIGFTALFLLIITYLIKVKFKVV